jgi:glucose/arabinose dehydrogenase
LHYAILKLEKPNSGVLMRIISLTLSALLLCRGIAAETAAAETVARGPEFSASVLASGLEMPWEVTMAPDNFLWVTERMGKRVSRINSETGEKSVVLTVDETFVGKQHEGLLGLALHPGFGRNGGSEFVYVVYTYDSGT